MRLVRAGAMLALLLSGLPQLGQAGGGEKLAFLRAYPTQGGAAGEAKPNGEAEPHVAQRAVRGGFYDPTNPDLERLQDYETATAGLPKDPVGFPDWMRAIREGTIKPRAGLSEGAAMNPLNLDVILKNTKQMPYVRFPHYSHTLWLDCSNCHPKPFEMKAGSTAINMTEIFRGKFCGMCHDRVAFITFFSCQRCHSVPQPGGEPAAKPAQ
ncbi:MAG TPA: c(7)-type cytochrome triheme domain-containing protein [Rhodocyclaceae bacterium]